MKKRKQHGYCKARIAWRLKTATPVADLQMFLLGTVSIDVPIEALEKRTPLERAQAEEWASQVHLSASDNSHIRIPPKPAWLPEAMSAADLMRIEADDEANPFQESVD